MAAASVSPCARPSRNEVNQVPGTRATLSPGVLFILVPNGTRPTGPGATTAAADTITSHGVAATTTTHTSFSNNRAPRSSNHCAWEKKVEELIREIVRRGEIEEEQK